MSETPKAKSYPLCKKRAHAFSNAKDIFVTLTHVMHHWFNLVEYRVGIKRGDAAAFDDDSSIDHDMSQNRRLGETSARPHR